MIPPTRSDAPAVPSIIDTLSAGFQILHRAPWLIAIPVLLDLLLWLGPKLSIATLAQPALTRLASSITQLSTAAGSADSEQVEQFQTMLGAAREGVDAFNLLSLLAFGGLVIQSAVPQTAGGVSGLVPVTSASTAVALGGTFVMIGLLIACFWLGSIAQQVREGKNDPFRLLDAAPRYWLTIVGFFLLVIALTIAVIVPIAIFSAVMQLVSPAIGAAATILIGLMLQLAVFWGILYLFFFTDAVFISESGPVQSARNSIRVVSSNFWSALGFLIITWVIMGGMGVIWDSLARAPVGVVVAILGNGYIQSGLAAASMLFYSTRFARLPVPQARANDTERRG